MKRILTIICIALIAASAHADAMRLYCQCTQEWWTGDDAAIAIYAYANGDVMNAVWPGERMMRVTGTDGMWYAEIDSTQYTNVIFVRVNGSGAVEDWGAKTQDLAIPTDGRNLFTITSTEAVWGDPGVEGIWSVLDESGIPVSNKDEGVNVYSVVGSATLLGYEWDVSSTATEMSPSSDSTTWTYTIPTVRLVVATKYEYKIVADHSWENIQYPTDGNYTLAVPRTGTYQITFTLTPTNGCTFDATLIEDEFPDFSYSKYAVLVNHERFVPCCLQPIENFVAQYLALVQLNVGDTIRMFTRGEQSYEKSMPDLEESGEYANFSTPKDGYGYLMGYYVCNVAGCYSIYFKQSYAHNSYANTSETESVWISSASTCHAGEDYASNISAATARISVTDGHESVAINAHGRFIEKPSETLPIGSTVELEVFPNSGYMFVEWSDGSIQNKRRIVVTEDISLSATVVSIASYPLGLLVNGNRFIRTAKSETTDYGYQNLIRAQLTEGETFVVFNSSTSETVDVEMEAGGLSGNFSIADQTNTFVCNVSGCYDVYVKKNNSTLSETMYIGEGTVCNDGVPWTDPNTGYVYSVVGTENLFGTAWDIADTLTNMTPVGDGRFEYTLDSVTLTPEGDYQYKVIANHMWNVREYPSVEEDDNYHITVEESGVYSVLFSLDTIAGCSATTNYLHAITGNSAHIWNISPSSPSEGDNLRIALSTAENGDTIVMAAGTYVESSNDYISFNGKHVIVKAEDGADVIIQPQTPIIIKEGGCAHFENIKFDVSRLTEQSSWFEHLMYPNDDNEGNSIILEGCEFYDFTLNSSLLYCATAKRLASLSINNCYFHNITKSCLYIENTDEMNVLISNSTFANITTETSSYYAGVIDTRATAGTFSIDHCTFYNVQAMNTDYAAIGKVKIPDATVSNCIFAMPESTSSLRAIRDVTTANNCLIFNYTNDSGYGIHSEVIINNCIKEQDPLFADAANGDFTLESGSPAIGAATDGSNLGDPRWGTNENIPSTDFSVPYIFVGETATLSGNIQLNDLGHIAYADSKDNGIASWKINVTRECNVKVTITMETGSSSGHQFVVDILDEHQEIIAELTQPSAQYGDAAIELPDSIAFITPGVYTIRLSNLTEWSAAIVEGVLFTAITSGSDLCTIASGSCGADGDNLTWVLGCDSVLTISGEGEMPTSYSGTSAPWYEHGAAIKHINIEEGVTKLALYAFYNSGNNYPNVQTLSIPSTLGAPIENNFFYQCPLKTITINSDTIVGKASYSSGSSLQNKFGAQVEEYIFGGSVRSIANFAFYNQSPDSLRSIILPEGLEAIGNWAFGYIEHLTSVSIPSTVQTIGTDAFAYCSNLRSVELGEGLMTVNGQAFWMCDSLTRVTCNALTPPTLNQTAFDHNQNDTLFIPCEAKESYKQADYWKNFSKIMCADDTLQILASGTFGAQSNNLTWTVDRNYTLTISGSGEMEFFNASEPWAEYRYQLRKIVVEEGVTNLSNVFRLHNQVTEVSLPNTLRVIEAQAFDQCSSITHLELPESVDSIGEGVFYLCESLQEIRIPSRVTMINSSLFRGCRGLRSVEFPNGLTRILTTAFQYCNELNALHLPASLTFIGQEAFADCTGLDTIIVLATTPPEVTQSAFDNVPDTIPVFVPTASLRAYRNHEEWSYFKNIHGIDGDGPQTYTFTLTSAWQFIMLPTVFGLTQDDIVVDGEIEWGVYNSAQRASGRSGWQGFTPQNGFEGSQAYIVRARNGSATLTINIPDQAREQAAVTMAISYHPATREQNANWNFLGNPYPYNYDIMSALEEADIESPVTIWNGTGYDLFTPGIDLKTLDPFEAFFIQLPEGGLEVLPLSPEHIKDTSDSGNNSNSVADENGALPGYFTINTSKQKVQFSRGNLQYQASTATWQFAENQYDVIGEGNVNISATYDGWIDLFGWGTGDNPTKASTSKCDYSGFVDWGINAISNGGNTADMWRTLSANEWTYITGQRTNYESLCGRATVNGIQGFILLPDDWVSPGVPFQGSKDNGYELNQFTLADWQKMEAAGAVFLPACGGHTGTEMTSTAVQYWSTNEGSSCYAYDIITGGDTAYRLKTNQVERSCGYGVRLVK